MWRWSVSGRKEIRKEIERIRNASANIFHYPTYQDSQLLDFVLLPAMTLNWTDTNPLWCQVIGAPGSGKTAHIMFLEEWERAAFVSRLTKNSLISGYRPEGDLSADPSFLKQLDKKLMIVKDFTCIIQGPREERDAVIGQLRDAFDGSTSRVMGNVGKMEYKARFNLLLAVTHIIDGFYGVTSQLGERFISRREFAPDRINMAAAAFDNIFDGTARKRFLALRQRIVDFVNALPPIEIGDVEWPLPMRKRAILGADLVATCRSHVTRESSGMSIATRPAPEVGTRLVSQVAQAVTGFCLANGVPEVNMDAWMFGGARILRDTMPTPVAWTLSKVLDMANEFPEGQHKSFTTKDILPLTRLGYHTTGQVLMDLHYNGVLEARYLGRTGRRMPAYHLSNHFREVLNATNMFDGYSDSEVGIETLRARIRKAERKRKSRRELAQLED